MNCAYKMRRTRIQSDAKNLLFDCPLHQLGCYARSFQARSLRSKYVYAKVMGMPIPVIQCTLGQLGKRLQTRQGCDVVRSSLPVNRGGGGRSFRQEKIQAPDWLGSSQSSTKGLYFSNIRPQIVNAQLRCILSQGFCGLYSLSGCITNQR